jgi:hypothetical protein
MRPAGPGVDPEEEGGTLRHGHDRNNHRHRNLQNDPPRSGRHLSREGARLASVTGACVPSRDLCEEEPPALGAREAR